MLCFFFHKYVWKAALKLWNAVFWSNMPLKEYCSVLIRVNRTNGAKQRVQKLGNIAITAACGRSVQIHRLCGIYYNLNNTTKQRLHRKRLIESQFKNILVFCLFVSLGVASLFCCNRSVKIAAGTSMLQMWTRNHHVGINKCPLGLSPLFLFVSCQVGLGKPKWSQAR